MVVVPGVATSLILCSLVGNSLGAIAILAGLILIR